MEWNVVRMEDVCSLQNGFAFKSRLFKPSGTPILRISSIQNDEICDNRPVFTDPSDYKESLFKYEVHDGDLLIAMSGATTGKVGFNRTGATYLLNQRVGKFIPSDKLNINYLFLFLLTKVEENLKISAGAAQPNLSTKQIKDFLIPLPSISEQKRIVAILDEAFASISQAVANAKKNLANARELFDSYLNNVFTQKGDGWFDKKLGNLTEVKSGGTPLRSKQEYWGGEIAWYSSGELNKMETHAPERTVTIEGINNSNAKLFPKGSLLIGMYDTAALKMSILDRGAAFNQAISGMMPNDGVELRFVLHAINANKSELLNLRRGVRQKNLSLGKIKDIVISIPDFPEQQLVVNKLSAMEKEIFLLEFIYRQKLAALTELKQSILQKAFSGELTSTQDKQLMAAI